MHQIIVPKKKKRNNKKFLRFKRSIQLVNLLIECQPIPNEMMRKNGDGSSHIQLHSKKIRFDVFSELSLRAWFAYRNANSRTITNNQSISKFHFPLYGE